MLGKRVIVLLVGLFLLTAGTFYVLNQDSVTYDAATGGFLQVQDFADVTVEGGLYVVDYALDKKIEQDKIYYQLCRSGQASSQPDGFNAQKCVLRVVEYVKQMSYN